MLEAIFSWNALRWVMWILYIPSCIGLIVIVLLQKGKSSGFAGAFGVGGGSDAVFGPRSRQSLPVKMTYGMAVIFVVLAFCLSVVEGKVSRGDAPAPVETDEMTGLDTDALYESGLGEAYEDEGGLDALLGGEDAPADELPAADEPAALETPADAEPEPAPADSTPVDAPGQETPAGE
jgi:preprotein translocase subunit SecG